MTIGPEHKEVRLPLIEKLKTLGWKVEQMQWVPEWQVPQTPSEASKRELGKNFKGFPIDLAIFEEPEHLGSWEYIQLIFETKSPNKKEGISQLEQYLSREPRALAGFWTNGSDVSALYRRPDGTFLTKEKSPLPKPGDNFLTPTADPLKWGDLKALSARELRAVFQRLLDHVVSNDAKSTRRDQQLNQLCNLLLIKLESDKRAKAKPKEAVIFQVWKNEKETFSRIDTLFESLQLTHNELFSSVTDKKINLEDATVQRVCYELSSIKLLDASIDILSTAFQVFRTASLKSEEGQYFTPLPVIRSAVALMDIDYEDKIVDPACGSGGFLLEAFHLFREKHPAVQDPEAKEWAQKHLYGVDKDEINIKLTKAVMMILGDGSAHTYLGDSLREHLWGKKWPHLVGALANDSYTCIITNPPFGKNLKINPTDARHAHLTICQKPINKAGKYSFDASTYEDRELGLAFLERCYRLLVIGGRLGIVLPETYLFSKSYGWLQEWLEGKMVLRGMFNIPMEAFQGFCRAKTNFYVFEKV